MEQRFIRGKRGSAAAGKAGERMKAEELVQLAASGPTWCLNLDVISPASRRSPGFGGFLEGRTHLRVAYTDMEAGGKNHRVAKPREKVIIKDGGGDPSQEGAVVGVGEIVANYHNPENPFLKISLQTRLEPPVGVEAVGQIPGGDALYARLGRPVLFEIIE